MRNSRYTDIISNQTLSEMAITVIGLGAIGRPLALSAAAMGIPQIELWDHDRISEENLGPQGWNIGDLEQLKVDAVKDAIEFINPECIVTKVSRKFDFVDGGPHPLILCCVDTMSARTDIFNKVHGMADAFIDGRMAARTFQCFTHLPGDPIEAYRDTLFSDEEASPLPCTAKSTIYTANIAAGFMLSQLVNAMTIEKDFIKRGFAINLLSMELTHDTPSKANEESRAGSDVPEGEPGDASITTGEDVSGQHGDGEHSEEETPQLDPSRLPENVQQAIEPTIGGLVDTIA